MAIQAHLVGERLAVGGGLDLVPGHRRRHRRVRPSPQRVGADRRLVAAVLAPVDEDLVLASSFGMGGHDQLGVGLSIACATASANDDGVLVGVPAC